MKKKKKLEFVGKTIGWSVMMAFGYRPIKIARGYYAVYRRTGKGFRNDEFIRNLRRGDFERFLRGRGHKFLLNNDCDISIYQLPKQFKIEKM